MTTNKSCTTCGTPLTTADLAENPATCKVCASKVLTEVPNVTGNALNEVPVPKEKLYAIYASIGHYKDIDFDKLD